LFKDRVDQKIWMNKRWRMYWITNHFYGRTPSLRGRCVCVADLIVMLWLDLSFDCVVIEQFYVHGMGMELYCLRRLMPLFTDPFYFDSIKTWYVR
jgi:hypothetical protein